MPSVTTVTGELDAEAMGITLPHEHLLVDISVWADLEGERKTMTQRRRADAPVTMEDLWWMGPGRAFGSESRDNWRLDDPDLAVEEANRYVYAGGETLVDVTPMSPVVARDPRKVRTIAHRTGLNVVAGTGHYVRQTHPDRVEDQTAADLADEMISELTDGMDGTDVRAGIIGEIGTSHGYLDHENERKSVRGAAIAQQETGAAITLHPPFFYQEAHDVLDDLEAAGADLDNVIVGHMDCSLRLDGAFEYYQSIADRGPYLEFDTFGRTGYHATFDTSYPLDADRIEMLRRLFDAGYDEQVVIAQDVCKKTHLTRYGGIGYDYILRDIVPRLKRHDFSRAEIDQLLIETPAAAVTH